MSVNNSARFVFRKSGIYYFVRRVPRDLADHYSAGRLSFSLRTRSKMIAAGRAAELAQRLDRYWYHLRASKMDVPGQHLLRLPKMASDLRAGPAEAAQAGVTLSEAAIIYKTRKGAGKGNAFERTTDRAVGYLIGVCGDRLVSGVTRKEANGFRDYLIGKGLTGSSISRMVSCVRAVINCAASEEGVEAPRAFTSLQYDRHAGVRTRCPIPLPAIRAVQAACRTKDDDLRWLVALVSDTGMRLSEAAGLAREDIQLDAAEGAYLDLVPRPWRSLKTPSSQRLIPLVGASLWAAERALQRTEGIGPLFCRHVKNRTLNANSASAAVNKWLGDYVPVGCSIHGMRHAMRDRLRAVECPSDVIDQIGGWITAGVGQGYGKGYPVSVLRKWLIAIE